MKTRLKSLAKRLVAQVLIALLAVEPAMAATVTISSVPLATSSGSNILPNLLFVLDSSGSMAWNYLPDYVNDSRMCMPDDGDDTACSSSEAPFMTGGSSGLNGVAYDPNVYYKPGLTYTGTTVLTEPLTVTSVPYDAYGAQSTSNANLTTDIGDRQFCNANGVCKRNGAASDGSTLVSGTDASGNTMSAGRFPYRTHASNSSTAIFGLPETMSMGTFVRASGSSTVTVTTIEPHGLTTGNVIYTASAPASSMNVNAAAVTVSSTTVFTYTSTNTSSQSGTGRYRKHSTGSWTRSSSTVTVAATAHGLQVNDIIYVQPASSFNTGTFTVTAVAANSFTYSSSTGSGTIAGTWVRSGLYNDGSTSNGTPISYFITPIEYCSDDNLTNCVQVIPPASPPSGYIYPAYVRFCQTQEQALAPAGIGDSSGTPRCRSKFVGSGSTQWRWARYGWFNRDNIKSTVTSYANRPNRTDCAAAPTCTYTEEIQNYARWFTYYRTRMQMMKTAAGRSFVPFVSNPSAVPPVPNKLRVGFITINPFYPNDGNAWTGAGSSVNTDQYLKISPFNTTQASSWFTKFYNQKPAHGTPLQEALSRAGWIFSGKLDTGLTTGIPKADDPMEASCQRNFTLLTTDGYWNGNYGQDIAGATGLNTDNVNNYYQSPYTSVMIDRTNTGTFDGGVGTVTTTTTPAVTNTQTVCYGNGTASFSGGGSTTGCGCSGTQQRLITRATTVSQVVNATDGVVTSTNSTTSDVFTANTACEAAHVVVTTTPVTQVEEQLVVGNASTTFPAINGVSTGANSAGTCSANFGRIKRRTTVYNATVTTTNGTAGASTGGAPTYSFTDEGSCVPLTKTVVTQIQEVAEYVGPEGSGISTAYSAAGNGTNPQTTFSCSGSGTRTIKLSRTLTYNRTEVTVGAGATTTTNGPNTSVNHATAQSCSTSGKSAAATVVTPGSPNTTYAGGPTPASTVTTPGTSTVTSTSGTLLAVTQSPNPGTTVVGTPVTTSTPGGYQDTLADTAMYYYRTDLRGGTDYRGNATGPSLSGGGLGTVDVATNNVPAKEGAKDFATHQHMVTYTVGMVDGLMKYRSDYETATTGDFANVKNGTNNGCFWVTGTCNWPQPINDDASALDDLWHAAVNGRGQFYSATNVDGLTQGIGNTLTSVNAQVAAAAASATSSPNVTQTDNQIFSTVYETDTWSGKVFAQTIDPVTGQVNATIQWQADTLLLNKVGASSDTRAIWMLDTAVTPTLSTKLKPFTYSDLTAAEKAWFTSKCSPSTNLSQCAGLNSTNLAIANDGTAMVNFLRGHTGNEATVFRDRKFIDPTTNAVTQTVLGDTISAKPAYVRRALFNYADAVTPSYSTFATSTAITSRPGRVYVGANDGFLHAFDGDTGEESWAYAPRFLMSGLYALTDTGYSTAHRYFVDGSPEFGDVYDTTAGAWKTILVGGAGGGGRGFYAIDITSATEPKGLWEFCSDSTLCASSDVDLGLAYGNPIIGKRSYDGKWVVVVSSGLNNVSSGSGIGYFYVLDAITGTVLNKISTGVGDAGTPSGLMKMSAYYDSAATDATFRYIYAGDQLGNVWRLDVNTATPTVLHIASLKDGSTPARAQPITTRPALTHIGSDRILYVGTGRFLGSPDLSDPGAASGISWQQSLYAFKDRDTDYSATYTSLRADTRMVKQTLSSLSPTTRGISNNAVDWGVKSGWYVDFNPSFSGVENSPGEGVNLVDPRLVLGTLVVTTNAPSQGSSSCSVGGSSFDYNFDFRTGQAVSTSAGGVVGRSLGGTITVGVAIVQLPSGAIKAINTGADTTKTTQDVSTSASSGSVKAFSYRIR